MKFLFKIIVIPILSIVAVPAIFLALTYRDVAIPVDDFQSTGTVTLTEMISDEVDTFLQSNDSDSTLGLTLTQQDVNGLLKSKLQEMNPNYLSDSAIDDEKNYVLKEDMYGYQGSWVRFKEDVVEIESGVHIFVQGFTFKTAVLITFKLSVDTEEIVLKLDKLNIGSLPLAWTFGTASWAVKQISGKDIQEMIDAQLNGMATFDPDTREIRVNVQTLIDTTLEDPQTAAMANSLMQFIAQNELLDVGFADGEFNVDLALGKLKDDTTPFMLDVADKIVDETDLQSIMEAQASSLIFSVLTTTDYPFIELNAFTLNRMFEYFLRDSLTADGIIMQAPLFDDLHQMTAYVPYVTMDDDVFIVNIPLVIEEIANPANTFPTIIKMTATPEISGNDLRIVLNELNAGEVVLTQEHIGNILSLLGDTDLIVDGAFVFQDFDSQMNQAGMGLQSVTVVNENLRLYVELNSTLDLGDIQDVVTEVFDAIVDNPEYPDELNTALNDVIDSLTDPLADPQAAVEDLIDVFDTLTDEEQTAVYEDLLTAFEGTDLSLDEILGLLP
ncbi:MAG: hypothetical protein KKH01_06755 [Firmicutes bacterium]|nr:hypothetical protein [Bacillota bacterium]